MKFLDDWSMDIPVLFYFNTYLNVPSTENTPTYNYNLITWVEELGKKYGKKGNESNLKKGMRFLKEKTGCPSIRQIKMMMRSVPVAYIHNENENAYIFRCSINYYTKLLTNIIQDPIYVNSTGEPNSEYLIYDVKIGLDYVNKNGKDKCAKIANKMLDDLKKLD